jgi:hypothetical protein
MVTKVFPARAVPDLANGTSPVRQGPLYRAVRGRSGVCLRPPPVKTASSRPAVIPNDRRSAPPWKATSAGPPTCPARRPPEWLARRDRGAVSRQDRLPGTTDSLPGPAPQYDRCPTRTGSPVRPTPYQDRLPGTTDSLPGPAPRYDRLPTRTDVPTRGNGREAAIRRNGTCLNRTYQNESEEGRISVFGFGPGTLLVESPFRHRSEARASSKTAGSTPSGKSPRHSKGDAVLPGAVMESIVNFHCALS